MVVRAHRINQVLLEEVPLQLIDPRLPAEGLVQSVLSPGMAAQIREMLPIHLRFSQWELAYTPGVHGVSLRTFYQQQEGPNIIVVRDAHGGIFGGFATNPWRPTSGSYGLPECFAFAVREASSSAAKIESVKSSLGSANSQQQPAAVAVGDLSPEESNSGSEPENSYHSLEGMTEIPLRRVVGASVSASAATVAAADESPSSSAPPPPPADPDIEFFWAVPKAGRLIQWSDHRMIGLGYAV